MTTLIEVINHGPIRELRLARPPVNALDTELCRALIVTLNQAMADDVQGVVLSGSERIFTGGMDVPYLLRHGEDKHKLLDSWQAFFGAARTLAESRIPVVAALTGHSPAGGCVLALCCDYRIMARSEDASRPFRIGLNETQVGLVAPDGIQALMARVVGPHRAERLLVSGAMVDADEALRIGLVDELAAIDAVETRARLWLEELLQLPREPMLATRRIARAAILGAVAPERIDLPAFVARWTHPDTQAALRAMLARIGK